MTVFKPLLVFSRGWVIYKFAFFTIYFPYKCDEKEEKTEEI